MWVLSHWLSLKGLMFTVSVLKTLYSGQITVWTQLINPNYLFIPTTDATPHIFMLVCGTCGEQDEIQLPGNVLTVHDGAVQQHQSKLRQKFYLVFFFLFFHFFERIIFIFVLTVFSHTFFSLFSIFFLFLLFQICYFNGTFLVVFCSCSIPENIFILFTGNYGLAVFLFSPQS